MPWNSNTWFNSLTLVDKIFQNFPKSLGSSRCFTHGRPKCLWTIVLVGITILDFLTWMTLMDELELIRFSVHHQKIFPFLSRSTFMISFPKRSRRNSTPINTLYKEVDYCYVLINKSLLEMFSLLFCLLAQCSYRTQVSWKCCTNCVLQILLLHAHTASIGQAKVKANKMNYVMT